MTVRRVEYNINDIRDINDTKKIDYKETKRKRETDNTSKTRKQNHKSKYGNTMGTEKNQSEFENFESYRWGRVLF